jgi:hypothetical protein
MRNNYVNNSIQNKFNINYNNSTQIIVNYTLIKFGLKKSIICIILMFL